MSSPIRDLDHNTAQFIIGAGEAVSSINPFPWLIQKLEFLLIEDKKEIDDHVPTPFDWVRNGAAAFRGYHGTVFKKTSSWSHSVKDTVSWTFSQILHPLSFCKIGRALQHTLSYDLMGSIAQSIAFCALQVFHLLPYIAVGVLTAGTISLYQNNPIALTAILAGGMLTTQLWFIYRLVKTVDATKKTFEQKADDFIAAINLVQIAKNTFWSGCDLAARGIRWSVSWIPTGQKKQAVPQQPLPQRAPIAE